MDFKLFALNVSSNKMDAKLFYDVLDEKMKKELFLSFKNYRPSILKTIEEVFNFKSKKNQKFIIDFLVDFTQYISQEEAQSYVQCLSDFLYENNPAYSSKDKSKVTIAFIKAGMDTNSQVGEQKNYPGTPLIHFVAGYCDLTAIKYFVENGAKLDIIDDEQDSVLSSTMIYKPNAKILKYLLNQKGIDYLRGDNILAVALKNNYDEIVKVIKESHLIHDEQFLQNCEKACDKQIWTEFLSIYEKEKLEKLTQNSELKNAKKLKL